MVNLQIQENLTRKYLILNEYCTEEEYDIILKGVGAEYGRVEVGQPESTVAGYKRKKTLAAFTISKTYPS
jgi:hypothetical protein